VACVSPRFFVQTKTVPFSNAAPPSKFIGMQLAFAWA
jgi:hypothetical protein